VSENSFVFAAGGQPACALVVSSLENDEDVCAAAMLAEAIEEISGARPAIVPQGHDAHLAGRVLIGTPADHLGVRDVLRAHAVLGVPEDLETEIANRQLLQPHDLRPQDFVIYLAKEKGQNALVVAGNTRLSILYGVHTLINRLFLRGGDLMVDWVGTRLLPTIHRSPYEVRSMFTNIGGPDELAPPDQWAREWGAADGYDYEGFVDWLVSHKINHILLPFDLDFGLVYPSERFPEAVNPYHPNVKHEFFGDMFEYAHRRGMEVFVFASFPDCWSAVVRAYPELAGVNLDRSEILGDEAWQEFQRTGIGRFKYRLTASWVCGSKPEVLALWRAYWEEVMDRYPGINGVGLQACEHPETRCNCVECRNTFWDQSTVYFEEMVKIAQARNPQCRPFTYKAWGGSKMIEPLRGVYDPLVIDWWATFPRFLMRNYVPRSEYYLYHRMHEEWPEFGFKQVSRLFAQHGVTFYQIRGVKYLETDHLYQAYEEFAWDPDLSVDDYAFLYVLKRFRREDRELAEAYAHWIRATGYAEILADPDAPRAWVEREGYKDKLKAEVAALTPLHGEGAARLSSRLAEIGVPAEYVESARQAACAKTLTRRDLAWNYQAIRLRQMDDENRDYYIRYLAEGESA